MSFGLGRGTSLSLRDTLLSSLRPGLLAPLHLLASLDLADNQLSRLEPGSLAS